MRRWRSCLLSLLMLVPGAGACAQSESREPENGVVTLRHSPERPVPGGRVTLILRNGSTGTVGYNLCTSALTQELATGWEAVPSDRVCTMELRLLDPGQEDEFVLELPGDLDPGSYRFETVVERMPEGPRDEVVAEPFTIEG